MGVAIPGGQHNLGFTGAKQVGGSVILAKNNPSACHLYRDMGGVADGNRKTWTFSCWLKRNTLSAGTRQCFFSHGSTSNGEGFISFGTDDKIYFGNDGHANFVDTDSVYRDTFGWYHIVWAADSSQGSNDDRWKLYVNGILVPASDYGSPSITSGGDGYIQYYNSESMDIAIGDRERGIQSGSDDPYPFDGQMCEVYFIDGAQKSQSDFGFTDPLTGNWRPKAYTGTYGTYGWYLPCDGSAAIGEDQSGNKLDFVPIKFCPSATIDKANGALPILNTVNGGTVGTVGVRTDSFSPGYLELAIPGVGICTDVSAQLNGGSTTKPLTPNSVSYNHHRGNYYNASMGLGSAGDYIAIPGTDLAFGTGDFTIEFWLYHDSNGSNNPLFDFRGGATNGHVLRQTAETTFEFRFGNSAIGSGFTSGPRYHWNHYAIVRKSSVTKIYVNGAQAYSENDSNNASSTGTKYFNANDDDQSIGVTGNWQDIRVYKGIAKYEKNFLPGSGWPMIVADSPSGAIRPTELTLAENSSVQLDGNDDYLSIASHSDLRPGSGDFTVEAWVYWDIDQSGGDTSWSSIFGVWNSSSNRRTYSLQIENSNSKLHFYCSTNGSDGAYAVATTLVPVAKWTHVAGVRDGDVLKVFVDGRMGTTGAFSGSVYNNTTDTFRVGDSSTHDLHGFISNCRMVKGTAVYTANFTPPTSPLTEITNTKLLCCQDWSSATTYAVSPGSITANGNIQPNCFNPFDDDINIAAGGPGNYATINDNEPWYNLTIARGALRVYSSSSDRHVRASFRMPEWGKYYWEMYATDVAAAGYLATGLYYRTGSLGASAIATAQGRYLTASGKKGGAGGSSSNYGPGFDDGDFVSIAVDMDNGKIWSAVNGIWCEGGNPVSGANAMYDDLRTAYSDMAWFPVCMQWQSGNVGFFNFGQRPFRYTPPRGYQPLSTNTLGSQKNSANREPGIPRSDKYFKVDDYAGTGATQRITGLNFQPDLVMLKKFSGGSDRSWQTYDAVRGATILMHNDVNNADQTQGAGLTAFNRDGFTLSTDDGCNGSSSSPKYMYYCWKAGGGGGTTGGEFWKDDIKYASAAAAGMDGGDITPTGVSVGTEQGFSIVGYTGNGSNNQTISHGLGRTPALCIVKNRDETTEWIVKHQMNTSNKIFYMDLTDGEDGATGSNHGIPADFSGTSTITLKTSSSNYNNVNKDTVKYIMYTWAEIPGFSSFGEYEGNNNDIGININIGFRPELLIIKKKSASENWCVMHNDTAMNDFATGSNCDHHLRFDNNSMDNTPGGSPPVSIDLLTQGFVHKDNSPQVNDSGTFVYMAWSKSPLNNLYGGQAIAR